MINVQGDSLGAGIVAHLSRKELAYNPDEDDEDSSEDNASVNDTSKLNGHNNPGFQENIYPGIQENITPL